VLAFISPEPGEFWFDDSGAIFQDLLAVVAAVFENLG
jgi:hypothetical protein